MLAIGENIGLIHEYEVKEGAFRGLLLLHILERVLIWLPSLVYDLHGPEECQICDLHLSHRPSTLQKGLPSCNVRSKLKK